MSFKYKAVIQSLQYAVYDITSDTLLDCVNTADAINPMDNSNLPDGVTVDVPLLQSTYNVIMIQDQYGNPLNLLLTGYQTGGS